MTLKARPSLNGRRIYVCVCGGCVGWLNEGRTLILYSTDLHVGAGARVAHHGQVEGRGRGEQGGEGHEAHHVWRVGVGAVLWVWMGE